MARIKNTSKYPITQPNLNDIVIGSRINDSGKTVNFLIEDFISLFETLSLKIGYWNKEDFYKKGNIVLHEIDCRLYLFVANKDNSECEPEIECKDCNADPSEEFWETVEDNIEHVNIIPVKSDLTIDSFEIVTSDNYVLLENDSKATFFKSDITTTVYDIGEINAIINRVSDKRKGYYTDEIPTGAVSLSETLVFTNDNGNLVKGSLGNLQGSIDLTDQLIFFEEEEGLIKETIILNEEGDFLEYPDEDVPCWTIISGGCDAEEITHTSQLINDGSDGENPFTTIENLLLQEDIPYSLSNGKSLGRLTGSGVYPAIGKTIEDVIRDIALEYLSPSFTSFGITQTTPIEVGVTISGNKNFTFAFQYPENVEDNSISIIDVTNGNTTIGTGLSKTSPVTANIGSISKAAVATHQWRGTAVNTQSNTIQSALATVTWNFRYFRGAVSAIPTDGESLRTAMLSNSIVSNANTFSFTTGTTLKDFVIAIPNHKTLVEAKNMGTNENLPFVLSGTITTVPDAGGTPRAYKVYTLSNAVPFSSNYNINVTLS